MEPLYGLDNRGNTCWCAATCQALRALRCAGRLAAPRSLFTRAMTQPALEDALIPHLFRWGRECLKNQEGTGHRPADPAEFLVELQDRDDMDTACFESDRVQCYTCQTCGHVRRETTQEKMLILPSLPAGAAPVRAAVDLAFGYLKDDAHGANEAALRPPGPPGPPPALSAVPFVPAMRPPPPLPVGVPGGALPLSMSEYGRRFAGPEGLSVPRRPSPHRVGDGPDGERWWRCDDGIVQEVVLTTATPYVLFYEERAAITAAKAEEGSVAAPDADRAGDAAPARRQILGLDCDAGRCGGTRQPHAVFVEAYEVGEVLAVHVACPRAMHMGHVERTLRVESAAGSEKAYDLQSFIAAVGGCHYVAYTRKR